MRELYFCGEVTQESATWLLQELQPAIENPQPVRLWVCSHGGDLWSAAAMYDAIARHGAVEVVATGQCGSAAMLLLLAAKQRLATPNTIFLAHAIEMELDEQDAAAVDRIVALPGRTIDVRQAAENAASLQRTPAILELENLPQGTFDAESALTLGIIHEVVK